MNNETFEKASEIKDQITRLNYDLETGYLEKVQVRELIDRWLTEEEKEKLREAIIKKIKTERDRLQKEFDAL
jgi:hypothetical protein